MSLNKLGRYDLIRVLGKGAMGLVYEARDPNLDRRVAIKTIKVENLSEEAAAEYEARFRTEARSAARLQHPNIVSVYDSDRHGDVAFLVMEFIEGEDLKHHLDSGKRYSLEQSLRMVGDLLSALEYAHRQSVVHRDVKPANLLIENDGRVKLTDFGVARIQDSSEATRTQGSMVGTLKYMSPEQVQGQPIDARADLFAVGIVLYQLLTGRRPFDGDTDFAIIQKIVGHTPDRPSLFNPLLPPAIDAVVLRALAKKREQRFTTAQDFARALQEASGQASDPTIVPPTSQPGGNATDAGRQRSHVGGSTVKLSSSGTDTGSTVTQELELVYWKDIKDSDDLEDLEGFLGRFPSGIYADLARRRVKRLTGTASDEGLGEGSGTATLAAADAEWARLQAQNVLKPAALASARVTASTVEANDPDATRMAGAGLPLADPRSPAAVAEPSPAVPTASRSKLPLFALAGVAVLVAAVVIFKRLPGTAAPVQVALPAVASEAPAASPAPPAALPRTPKPLPKPKSARLAAAETVVEPAAALATASNPGQACENRILLGFQHCMNEQCAKPAFSRHPVCVERRAMEKLRRESQEIRN
jgi:serine/threonine protein kinase